MATNDGFGANTGRELPAQFGRYRVEKLLARGGMGAVYLVTNTDLQRQEALKVPDFDAGAEAEMRERFLREARAAAGLDHPNLCPIYDVGERDGMCYLTMRFLDGRPLSDFTQTAQPPRKTVEIVTKLAQALAAAHAKGITHRDLKPGNVMMCAGVGPVVMDFGLAKQAQQGGRKLTRMGSILGTPAYMPPEQIKGDLTKLGPTSDVYSLGVILFEMLTGRLPFAAANDEDMYAAVLFTAAPAPSSMQPGLSAALDAICARALAKAPEDRFPSMKDFAAALIGYLKATPPAPGGGEQLASKGGTAKVFQMPTVGPSPSKSPAAAPGNQVFSQPTQIGGKAPSSIRPPKAPSSVRPAPTVGPRRSAARAPIIAPPAKRRGLSTGALIGGLLCFLLIVGGIGGVGALIYVINNQKKADDSKMAAVTTPVNDPTPSPAPNKDKPLFQDVDHTPTPAPTPTPTPAPTPTPTPAPTPTPTPTPAPAPTPTPTPTPAPTPTPTPPPTPTPTPTPTLKPDPTSPKPAAPDPAVLFYEDFKGVEKDGLPKGWVGPDFAVEKDEVDSQCLQVVNVKGQRFIALPWMPIKGDFQLECEFRLSGADPRQHRLGDHVFDLELDGRSCTPLTIDVNHVGGVRMDGGPVKNIDGFKPFEDIQFHLTRKGDSFKVTLNELPPVTLNLAGKGMFEMIHIGLPGGLPPPNRFAPNQFPARLNYIKVTSLEAVPPKLDPTTLPPPPPPLAEDFSQVPAGSLPEGWKKSQTPNISVRTTPEPPGLELTNTAAGFDAVVLPKVDLKGDFYEDVTAVVPPIRFGQPTASMSLIFKGRGKTLIVEMIGGGVLVVNIPNQPPIDGSKYWNANGPNVLRVERSSKEKEYLFRLNNTLVGNVPLGPAPGPFSEAELMLSIKHGGVPSPRVLGVRVVPLVPDP